MSKTGVIIEARMTSNRLPGKVLMEFSNGMNSLELIHKTCKDIHGIDDVIVATTINIEDDEIVNWCINNNINVFRGSEEDVMGRVLNAAQTFELNTIIEITGDCPLIDKSIVSTVLETYRRNNCDYISNCDIRFFPDGMDVQIFSTSVLNESYQRASTALEREHVTLEIRQNPGISKIFCAGPYDHYQPKLGLTLDTREDYIFLNKIINKLDDKACELRFVLELLEKEPELLKINEHIQRKGDS